jgi:hypothetical protein
MVYLKNKILILLVMLSSSITGWAQSFMYSYIDPCTGESKTIMADMSSPIIITYYGQIKSFSFESLSRGDLEIWMNNIYQQFKDVSPCQGAAVTTTTTSTTNQAIVLVNNIINITSLDFSSITSSVGNVKVDVGSTANQSNNVKGDKNEKTNNDNSDGGNTSDNNNQGSSSESSTSGSGSSNGGNSNNNNSQSSSNGPGGKGNTEQKKEETPTNEEIAETKTESEKQQSQQVIKSSSKAKTNVQKPAILVTGDIVGVQSASDASQDARGTMSFTRVKGDGTSSLGGSIDYMVNARIGNFSLMKSWISTNTKGHKGINVVSNSFTLLPGTWSNTTMFVRVNSLKKFTALYGAAGTYGIMFDEPLINTLAIGGFMYKGKLTKSLDGTIIMVGVWSPYMKYYTESILEQQPIVIPFINLTYKLTKTFGMGLTGGGTYITGSDKPLNYQILCGAKLIL